MLNWLRRTGSQFLRRRHRIVTAAFYVPFWLVPLSVGLAIVVYTRIVNRRVGNALAHSYARVVTRALRVNPAQSISSPLTNWLPLHEAEVLHRVGAFRETVRVLTRDSYALRSDHAALLQAMSEFELSDLDAMTEVTALRDDLSATGNIWLQRQKAWGDLLAGRERRAAQRLTQVAESHPEAWCPQQNLAARPPGGYSPTKIDLLGGEDALLFDAYNYLGQRVTHVGRGELGAALYGRAFAAQQRLNTRRPEISLETARWLEYNKVDLSAARIFPWEWSSQIGHLGLLDVQFQMRELGWWSGTGLVLAHPNWAEVANRPFLDLFSTLGDVAIGTPDLDRGISRELFSLQRYYGMAFNAWEDTSGNVVPWSEAAVEVISRWEAEARPLPLRQAFDTRYLGARLARDSFTNVRARWGMKPDDWYVCLHMRDPGFYAESAGRGQTHRNSKAKNYLEAVRYITDRGGWVIKLGGPRSFRLPDLPRVFDYARSRYKSELLDLFLIRQSRFFLGTTSGLTNIAISLGVPCALVNCITTDAQLWPRNVRFVPKSIISTNGRMLTQRELTSAPWRWRMFSAEVLRRDGAFQLENTADEILEVVKEVEALVDVGAGGAPISPASSNRVVERWRKSLALPHFYGTSQPSSYFLEKHQTKFLEE